MTLLTEQINIDKDKINEQFRILPNKQLHYFCIQSYTAITIGWTCREGKGMHTEFWWEKLLKT
jgi:hypothetical protein